MLKLDSELQKPLLRKKSEKVIRLRKHELGGKILTEFAALQTKTYSYLIVENIENKKEKDTKKCHKTKT